MMRCEEIMNENWSALFVAICTDYDADAAFKAYRRAGKTAGNGRPAGSGGRYADYDRNRHVYEMHKGGMKYREIAEVLNMHPKAAEACARRHRVRIGEAQ